MIEIKNIRKTYRNGKMAFEALQGVSLKVAPGEFLAIMGPSGSGKSTLLHILGLLDVPDGGDYKFLDKQVRELKEKDLTILRNHFVGFVFQQFYLLSRMSAQENVKLPLIYAGKKHLKEVVLSKLAEVGLSHKLANAPNELSGGEQQRVAIARALVNEPLILLADEPTGNLDTKSETEIMTILSKLNQNGMTIVMVTHEEEIAKYAKRIVRMRDGKIVEDKRIDKKDRALKAGESESVAKKNMEAALKEKTLKVSRAEFWDHLKQAVQAIFLHKMRSFLSILGILIGVAAVIAMLALGQGARDSISKSLTSLGSSLLTIRPAPRRVSGVARSSSLVSRFTLQDAQAIAKLSSIKRVSPTVYGRAQIVYGNKNWNTSVLGTGVEYEDMRASVPLVGRFFNKMEMQRREKVVLLGATIALELFGESNPVGSIVKVNRINFLVIGVLPQKGSSMWRDQDDLVIVPISTAMYRLLGKDYVDTIDAEVKSPELIEQAKEGIKRVIYKRHNLDEEDKDAFRIMDMSEIQETLQTTIRTLTWLLGSIAAIALLVGGIGIMNIMLVSVTERTSEIGLRKAIGARKKDILMQFLIEAILMTVCGGFFGVLLGGGIAILLSVLAGWATTISFFSIILATSFSIVIGLVFGLWPARQAARLNTIEALRYE